MKRVYTQTNNNTIKEIVQEGNHFFVRVTEPNGETFESGDFNTLESAKKSLGIKPTTEENNKLIAEFMGEKLPYKNEQNEWEFYVQGAGKVSSTNIEDLFRFMGYNYHNDWNWLMQAVEKCFKIEANYGLHKNIEDALIFNSENRIQDVYNAVVKFIEVYNESFKQEAVYSIRD